MSIEQVEGGATNPEQLTRSIVARAQDEVKLRDLLSFALVRIWNVVLVLGAVLFAWSNRPRRG